MKAQHACPSGKKGSHRGTEGAWEPPEQDACVACEVLTTEHGI